MRLKKCFVAHDAGGMSVLVPTGDSDWAGIVQGNATLGVMLGLLREGATRDSLVAALHERFDDPEGAIEGDVDWLIGELTKIDALE